MASDLNNVNLMIRLLKLIELFSTNRRRVSSVKFDLLSIIYSIRISSFNLESITGLGTLGFFLIIRYMWRRCVVSLKVFS